MRQMIPLLSRASLTLHGELDGTICKLGGLCGSRIPYLKYGVLPSNLTTAKWMAPRKDDHPPQTGGELRFQDSFHLPGPDTVGCPGIGSRTAGSVWGSPARTPRGSEGPGSVLQRGLAFLFILFPSCLRGLRRETGLGCGVCKMESTCCSLKGVHQKGEKQYMHKRTNRQTYIYWPSIKQSRVSLDLSNQSI